MSLLLLVLSLSVLGILIGTGLKYHYRWYGMFWYRLKPRK